MMDTQDPGWLSGLLARFSKNRKRAIDFDLEVATLLDAVVLSKPAVVAQGFILYDFDGSMVDIKSLSDLCINRPYRTEQQTPLVRNHQDGVIVGGKIILEVGAPAGTMSGNVLPEIALLALENQCRRSLNAGILFMEEDQNPKIFHSINELTINNKYISTDGEIALMRLSSGNVQFQFAPGSPKFQFDNSDYLIPALDFQGVSNKDSLRAKARAQWQWEDSKSTNSLSNKQTNNNYPSRRGTKQRPDIRHYHRVGINSDEGENICVAEEEEEEEKENKYQQINIQRPTTNNNKPNNKPKPNFASVPVGGDGRGERRGGTMRASPRRQIRQAPAYASTIPETGLVARLANKILQRWFNSGKKDVVPVELHHFAEPGSPTTERPVAAAPKEKVATNAPAPPPPPPIKAPPPPPPPPMVKGRKGPTTPGRKGAIKMKQLHWSVIPSNQLKTAEFWANISPAKFSAINETELASLFSISPAKEREFAKKPKAPLPRQAILDIRKANNTAIILSQFRLSPSCIREKIAAMDESITTDQLIALHSILTSISEQDMKEFSRLDDAQASTLNTSDLFVYELLRIPHAESRVRSWVIQRQMKTHIEDLANILDLVERACNEVRSSSKFSALLKIILALGSILNRGSYLSDAKGFKLDSLLRLGEMKARRSRQNSTTNLHEDQKKQYSLLHYLAEVIARDHPELLELASDLPSVSLATGMGLDNAIEILTDSKQNARYVSKLLEDLSKLGSSDPFILAMSPFASELQKQLDTLNERFNSTSKLYSSLAAYYGEDPKMLASKDFFSILAEFIKALAQAHTDNEKQKRKLTSSSSSSSLLTICT